ncbi:uncharacterized protein LOC108887035, partial [Lates japonicus]
HHVTKSDEGLYKCHISSDGESPPSWLLVEEKLTTTAPPTSEATPPTSGHLHLEFMLLRYLVVFCPYFISTVLMVSLYRHRPTDNGPSISMATTLSNQAQQGLAEDYDEVAAVSTEHDF